MKKLSVLPLLLLSGCFATAEPIFLPDGSSGYHISCGHYIGTMSDCLEKSGEMCGANGYQMFDQAGHPLNPENQNQNVIAALNNSSAKPAHAADNQQAMFIKCKTNDAPLHMTPAPLLPQVEVTPFEPKPASPSAVLQLSPPAATSSPIPLQNK